MKVMNLFFHLIDMRLHANEKPLHDCRRSGLTTQRPLYIAIRKVDEIDGSHLLSLMTNFDDKTQFY